MKKFVVIGAAGYIAPRHFRAIKETNNEVIAAMDKSDSVGIIDSFFPNAEFFTEFERLERHIEKYIYNGNKLDYVTICSPNYLHDAHIRFAMRQQADAICEKPLVLNPWNMDLLMDIEKRHNRKIFTILQLRLHPTIIELKKLVEQNPHKTYDIDLSYITSRGKWYFSSWKADVSKSGGIATNIGVHFYDMLQWIFGKAQKNIVHVLENNRAAGFLELKNARVRWFLSIDRNDLPQSAVKSGKTTYRSLQIEGKELEFSEGFTDLHTESYKNILAGKGFGVADTYESINIVYTIRNVKPIGLVGDYHPFLKK